MNSWKQYIPFIILNIIVSAVTVMIVLSLWNRPSRDNITAADATLKTLSPADLVATLSITPEAVEPTELPPLDEDLIMIQNVFGVGDLKNEEVVIKRLGKGELHLEGWTLKDEDGNAYIFPVLLLNKDGSVSLYSDSGTDSVVELHWGLDKAVWRTGETVIILDPAGNVRTRYKIP